MGKKIKLKKQELWVIVGALGVIALAVTNTLLFSDILLAKLDGSNKGSYRNVTFTDAVIQCQEKARTEYQNRLTQLALDDHSSRFDSADDRYKLFFNAEMRGDDDSDGLYISCAVNSRGRIVDFDGSEKQSSSTEAVRQKGGGMFGWPNK